MFDIHTHILPGVDDGSKDLETSKLIIEDEISNGVSNIVLTPHQNRLIKTKDSLFLKFSNFKADVKDYPINFYLGSEIYYYEGLIEDLKNDLVLTMNDSKYVLIEFSTRVDTPISDIVYDLVVSGYKPIIAHIERYSYLKKEDYFKIKKEGALIQINSGSFKERKRFKIIKFLLNNNLVDFIASDVHDTKERKCDFSFAKKYILKHHHDQYEKLFEEIPPFIKD
jgi:protein-tyrosine phosphatase